MDDSRRKFLKTAASGLVTVAIPGVARAASPVAAKAWPVAAFEKNFQKLSYDEIGRRLAQVGFQGIEATVRPGGHIDPERAGDDLPGAVEALGRHGMEIIVMASGINEVNALNEKVLRVAAKLGIRRYRMAYWRYREGPSVRTQLEDFRKRAADLAAMNKELGIQAIYQNHAGAHHVGGPLWDLQRVLAGVDPEAIGMGLDLRHCRVESGMSWKTTFDVVRPHVRMLYVKDALWKGDKVENVPLGTGLVTREVLREAVRGLDPVPVALHVEYFGGKPLDPDQLQPVIDAHRRDLRLLRKWMA